MHDCSKFRYASAGFEFLPVTHTREICPGSIKEGRLLKSAPSRFHIVIKCQWGESAKECTVQVKLFFWNYGAHFHSTTCKVTKTVG